MTDGVKSDQLAELDRKQLLDAFWGNVPENKRGQGTCSNKKAGPFAPPKPPLKRRKAPKRRQPPRRD